MGLASLMEMVQDWFRPRLSDDGRRGPVATPVLALAFIPLLGNHLTASRRGNPSPGFAVDCCRPSSRRRARDRR